MASAGRMALFFAGVVVAKCIATACTVGSGASVGALGPSVFLGGVRRRHSSAQAFKRLCLRPLPPIPTCAAR